MADSNSQPARCPCGFWGSPQTLGLCSKCYRERQQQSESGTSSSPANVTNASNGSALTSSALTQTISSVSTSRASTNGESKIEEEGETSQRETTPVETTDQSSSMQPPKEPSPGSKRDASEVDTPDPDQPVQKNKKRCFKCNSKLELAIREIGRCRCDFVFCQLHRLPEQHDCIFDHKEKGREEARNKMVSPKKHMGTSLKRIDSDS